MAPEYVMDGHFSMKSDVFSFGVMVLEIISGRRNADDLLSFVSMTTLPLSPPAQKKKTLVSFLDALD